MPFTTLTNPKQGLFGKSVVLYLCAFFAFSLSYTQIIPYFNYLGFSVEQRAAILTISSILGIVFQTYLGYLSDKYQTIRQLFRMVFSLFFLFAFLSFSFFQNQLTYQFWLVILFIAHFRVASNLIETWTYHTNEHLASQFGAIRLFGSLGWSIGSYFIAWVINRLGYGGVSIYLFIFSALTLLLTLWISDMQVVKHGEKISLNDVKTLLTNKDYTLSLLIYLILFLVYNLDSLTVVDKMLKLGANSQDIGFKYTLSALLEMPLFYYGVHFTRRVGLRKTILFLCLAMGVRYLLYGVSISVAQIMWITGLQLVTFPILLISQKQVVSKVSSEALKSSAQLLMSSVTAYIPILVIPFATAGMEIYFDYSMILILFSLLCFIAFGLTLFLRSDL